MEYVANRSLAEAMELINHECTRITACVRQDGIWFLTVESY